MPVTIDELEVAPAAEAPSTASGKAAALDGGGDLRRQVRGMTYDQGAAALSPRSGDGAAPPPAPARIGDGAASVSAAGSIVAVDSAGPVTINAPSVRINAAVTETSGVVKADKVIAGNVPATLDPAAGNLL